MKAPKVGFIGMGNIASAIIGGITRSGYIKHENIYVFDVNVDKSQPLEYKGAHLCENSVSFKDNIHFEFSNL